MPEPRYIRVAECTVWPDPTDTREVGWQLRYGNPDEEDRAYAAAALAAYRELVWMPERRRREVIRSLRAGQAE